MIYGLMKAFGVKLLDKYNRQHKRRRMNYPNASLLKRPRKI